MAEVTCELQKTCCREEIQFCYAEMQEFKAGGTDMAFESAFKQFLVEEERSEGTIEKYIRDVRAFMVWAGGEDFTKLTVLGWKEHLMEEGYKPVTVNSMIASVNAYLRFLGREDCKIRTLRLQRSTFRSAEKELTAEEFRRLVDTAHDLKKERLALLLETIGGTGIRVSEIKYITVKAAQNGRTEISLKGKIRTIMLPGKLCRKLLKYAKKNKIASGEIFLTRSGKGMDRKQIWAEMKRLCVKAGICATKVFPHNLRHLFARVFFKAYKNVVQLADVLGHSSIETTRIYLISTGAEHARQIEQLRLIS